MDGICDEQAWMVPTMRNLDGTDDEKEEEVGALNGPLFS